ncbi:Glyoxalase/Bleomycin resistance protein/Dihydroxybiphenyl dioxygenase [Aspergillus germanicus]
MSTSQLRPINHVAVSVPDIEATTDWYSKILNFQLIGNRIFHIKRSESPDAAIFAIYGASLNEVRLAYMATGNGVGFELFQFIDPPFRPRGHDFEYYYGGFFHICVTDDDPTALAERIVQAGGKRVHGDAVRVAGGAAVCQYVEDPWGNVVEILDMSFDRMATLDAVRPA